MTQRQERDVRELVRVARLRAGLSQEGLAQRMSALGEPTTRSQISMWELRPPRGRDPSARKLLAILEATRVERPLTATEEELAELERRLVELRALLSREQP